MTKDTGSRKKNKRRRSRITVLLLLVLLAASFVLLGVVLKDWRTDHVGHVAVTQDGSVLTIKWSSIISSSYMIEVTKDGELVLSEGTRTNRYRLEDIDYLADYEVTIHGMTAGGEMIQGASASIYTRSPQTITIDIGAAKGFAGDEMSIGASAETGLTYSIADTGIAKVDGEGNITFAREGETKLTIKAEGSDTVLPVSVTIPVVCFPGKLGVPGLTVRDSEGADLVMRIKKVKYAEVYELLRADPETGVYEIIREIDAAAFGDSGHIDIELANDIGTYSLRASADVGGTALISDTAEPVTVESDLDNAETYSSITIVRELSSDDVETVARARGSGSATHSQSICFTGDGYVVASVNRGNSTGCLEKFSLEGELIAKNTDTGHIGHANGCTYDPHTGNVYVMKTYASGRYHDIRVFDGETLESRDSISFGTAPSGIGYDATADQFYLTASGRIYVTDGSLKMKKTIHRKRAYHSQDVAGYNGIVLSCIWTSGSGSYIDMYRASDGAYLGSIYAPFGEIEGACVEDGHLVMLFNGGYIYRTVERVDFPG